jgi:polysaccharide biosynthesis/export protein
MKLPRASTTPILAYTSSIAASSRGVIMFHGSSVYRRMIGALAAMIVSIASMAAQGVDPAANSPVGPTKTATSLQTIAAGDTVQVSVFGHPELSEQVRVGNDGNARLSLLGELNLAGLTEPDAAARIAKQLRERNVLLHPQVEASIIESTSQSVSVIGEVQHPGVFPISGSRSLLDVLSLAGGLTNSADARINIKRRSGAEETITVAPKTSESATLSSIDAVVYPGDSVVVPHAGIVYVLGDVARPGGFIMLDSGRISLLQAMAQAGGPLPTAAGHHLLVLRKENGNYAKAREFDLAKVTRGQGEDVQLQASDIVFVPNDRWKSAFHTTAAIAAMAAGVSTVVAMH